jgi:hypothetical protein
MPETVPLTIVTLSLLEALVKTTFLARFFLAQLVKHRLTAGRAIDSA